jgi:plastocyanin
MHGAGPALVKSRWRDLTWTRGGALGLGLGLVGLAVILAGCGGAPLSSADTSVGCSVTVLIPSSGSSLLGSVVATVGSRSFDFTRNINTIAVGCGDQATLAATAADPSVHPFTHWTLRGMVSSAQTVTVTVDGLVSIRPGFLIPKVAPAPPPTPTPKSTATPSATPSTVTLDQWVSYDSATKTVTWKLEAGSPAVNLGLNFDGYDKGAMTVAVPVGWSVTVDFSNVGSINHSAAVVTSTGTTLVFPGAETPIPLAGTAPGQTATFTFTASQVGSYRMSCLIPGHETAGMWVTLSVESGGVPNVHL